MSVILGINAFHGDSSACLLRDGELVAAAEEERFRRIKHWAGFPTESVAYCLRQAGLALGDVDFAAINQDGTANIWRKLMYAAAKRPDLGFVLDRIRNKRERSGTADLLRAAFTGQEFRGEVRHVEHHVAHMASAYFVSPFTEASVVSVDGFGDFASAAWGKAVGDDLDVEDRIYFPHSLGIFYQAMTQYLGFLNYGDEYKVMGLAPYGEARYLNELSEVLRVHPDGSFELNLRYFRHHREKVDYEWDNGEPRVGLLYSDELASLLGPARDPSGPLTQFHKDVARSVQASYEKAFFQLLNSLHERHRCPDLAIAGGCGMNSVANGRVYQHTPFRRVYVQSAAGDAGGAIGAAYSVWMDECRSARVTPLRARMDHAYLGPEFSDEQIGEVLADQRDELARQGCEVRRAGDLASVVNETAKAIASGLVIGWFQGRMEWGPRALGNRSILADPRRADMKDILNHKIKRRESFRPFAPSILREHVRDWFETDDDVPFMMQVFQIREAQRERIPAVTHVDGSGRLQTVTRAVNSRYYELIEEFRRLTGVPMLLNTSFNENEPVVCRPEEALACFLRTRMDLLVMGNWVVRRAGQ